MFHSSVWEEAIYIRKIHPDKYIHTPKRELKQFFFFPPVEDPSDNFARLRDFVDAKNCLTLDSFSKAKLKAGFSETMVEEARKKLKLNKVHYPQMELDSQLLYTQPLFSFTNVGEVSSLATLKVWEP